MKGNLRICLRQKDVSFKDFLCTRFSFIRSNETIWNLFAYKTRELHTQKIVSYEHVNVLANKEQNFNGPWINCFQKCNPSLLFKLLWNHCGFSDIKTFLFLSTSSNSLEFRASTIKILPASNWKYQLVYLCICTAKSQPKWKQNHLRIALKATACECISRKVAVSITTHVLVSRQTFPLKIFVFFSARAILLLMFSSVGVFFSCVCSPVRSFVRWFVRTYVWLEFALSLFIVLSCHSD